MMSFKAEMSFQAKDSFQTEIYHVVNNAPEILTLGNKFSLLQIYQSQA